MYHKNAWNFLAYKGLIDLYSLSRYDEQKTECCGYCIIINNLKFQENDEAYRGGSEQDEERLGNLFKSLRFEVIIKRNLEKNQIEEVAQEYGGKDHNKFAVFVLIVMSQGDNRDCILGVDNRMTSVRALMREFQAERCPSLKGKPKIFIFQTCRGSRQCDVERLGDFVQSINADPTEFDQADNCVCPFSLDSSLFKNVFPPETDFLLAFATVPGYVSFRSPTSGAFFIQVLYSDFVKVARQITKSKQVQNTTGTSYKRRFGDINQGPFARNMISANHWLRSIYMVVNTS